tara:strand:+ start:32875 stop:33057 length:183 start_codon:yes stop_codon:yes gene_type:complete
MSTDLNTLLEMARKVDVSAEEREAQRRSFAYGNAHIENDRITRQSIDEAADMIKPPPSKD